LGREKSIKIKLDLKLKATLLLRFASVTFVTFVYLIKATCNF